MSSCELSSICAVLCSGRKKGPSGNADHRSGGLMPAKPQPLETVSSSRRSITDAPRQSSEPAPPPPLQCHWFICLDIDPYFDHEHDPEKIFEEGFFDLSVRPVGLCQGILVKDLTGFASLFFNSSYIHTRKIRTGAIENNNRTSLQRENRP